MRPTTLVLLIVACTAWPACSRSPRSADAAGKPPTGPRPPVADVVRTTASTDAVDTRPADAGAAVDAAAEGGPAAAIPEPVAGPPLWLVVGNPELTGALEPLAERRRAEGFEVVVSADAPAKAIASAARRPAFVLLVGDDEEGCSTEPWCIPAPRRESYRWQAAQTRRFAADPLFGDLDGDLAPDVPVGRIPARTADEVAGLARRIVEYEGRAPAVSDLRLIGWGGSFDYGGVLDRLVSRMALALLTKEAPPWSGLRLTVGDPTHVLCGDPPAQPLVFSAALRRGGYLVLMMGHAWYDGFFALEDAAGVETWFRGSDAEALLSRGPPAPPAIVISCLAGDFTRSERVFAEEFLDAPGGPVAVVAATAESHPLTNYYSGLALLRELGRAHGRLGELWLAAQRAARDLYDPLVEWQLKDAEGSLEEDIDVGQLRRDQLLIYALLGDPATRLRLPGSLAAQVERTEGGWRWRVERPEGASRLEVGWRAARPLAAASTEGRSRNPRRAFQRYEAANEALEFEAVGSFAADDAWEGAFDRPGDLRFVAEGPAGLRATTARLQDGAP
jgi:hypothetical protein